MALRFLDGFERVYMPNIVKEFKDEKYIWGLDDKGMIFYKQKDTAQWMPTLLPLTTIKNIVLNFDTKTDVRHPCTCEISVLMSKGCQCGGK